MRLAFDTSVLVAGMVEPHPSHARAMVWIKAVTARTVTGMCSWHAIAESWSVLTRLPLEPPVSPSFAAVAIERLTKHIRPLALTATTYREAIRRCSERGLRSGSLFDALHLVSAESAKAVAFVTFNPGDFERLLTAGSPSIVVPPDPPSLELPGFSAAQPRRPRRSKRSRA